MGSDPMLGKYHLFKHRTNNNSVVRKPRIVGPSLSPRLVERLSGGTYIVLVNHLASVKVTRIHIKTGNHINAKN